jgi:hypothetical protein
MTMSLRSIRNLITAVVMAAPILSLPAAQAQIAVGVSLHINVAPPVLPVYEQPPLPAPGYMWTPGYWVWSAFFRKPPSESERMSVIGISQQSLCGQYQTPR